MSNHPRPGAETKSTTGWRAKLHEIIFESDTRQGRAFDIALIWCIVISVVLVILESVPGIRSRYGAQFLAAEWIFTIIFTVEYILRLVAVRSPLSYARSFYGLVDLLAVLPTFLSAIFPGAQSLLVIRAFR